MTPTDSHVADLETALDTVRAFIWQESLDATDAEAGLRMLAQYVRVRNEQIAAGRAATQGCPVRLFHGGIAR